MAPADRHNPRGPDHEEAWRYALGILEPWLQATRQIGSDELTRVMENALAEAEREHAHARDVLASLERGE